MILLNLLDGLRVALVCAALFFGCQVGYTEGYNPIAQLHLMVSFIIVAIAGLSGLEGIFFGEESAKNKGFEVGGNYQKQFAIALLSYTVIAVIAYFSQWGIKAELTIFFTFMFFLFFAAINHGIDAVKHKNYKWQNINRPFLTLILIAGMIHPVVSVLKILK